MSKKNGRRVLKSVAKQVGSYRPDLKVGALGGGLAGVGQSMGLVHPSICVCAYACVLGKEGTLWFPSLLDAATGSMPWWSPAAVPDRLRPPHQPRSVHAAAIAQAAAVARASAVLKSLRVKKAAAV